MRRPKLETTLNRYTFLKTNVVELLEAEPKGLNVYYQLVCKGYNANPFANLEQAYWAAIAIVTERLLSYDDVRQILETSIGPSSLVVIGKNSTGKNIILKKVYR